jgi:hypothetical protein
MKIREVVKTLNRMRAVGAISRYAIGGAVGATIYLEPIATLDVDVFVPIKPRPGSQIATLAPIYEYLQAQGCKSEGEYIVIADWLVQFLPATGPLIEEALTQSREVDIDGEKAAVMSAEHLAAIALQTGRAKDKARILQFMESGVLDRGTLEAIIARHGLMQRWQNFQRQFGEDAQ